MDTDCEVCMIGLDFSAASDCVNHEALIFTLSQIVGGTCRNILVEFLTGKSL